MTTENASLLEYERRFTASVSYEEIVAYADKVSSLPHAVIQLLELLDDADADARRLVDAVSADPMLLAALLKLANSTLFAQAGKVTSAMQAVTTIGYSKLRSLVLATSLRGVLRRDAVDKLVWEHSIATAMIARKLASTVAPQSAEELFTIGLLHRLGQFVMLASQETRAAYPAILRQIRETGADYVTAETEQIGFAHPLIGALVARRWNFPTQACHVILHYANPVGRIETATDQKLALIKLSGLIANAARLGKPEGHVIELETIKALTHLLGITHPKLDVATTLIVDAKAQFREEAHMWPI